MNVNVRSNDKMSSYDEFEDDMSSPIEYDDNVSSSIENEDEPATFELKQTNNTSIGNKTSKFKNFN